MGFQLTTYGTWAPCLLFLHPKAGVPVSYLRTLNGVTPQPPLSRGSLPNFWTGKGYMVVSMVVICDMFFYPELVSGYP